jgi:hypothetical protein
MSRFLLIFRLIELAESLASNSTILLKQRFMTVICQLNLSLKATHINRR